MNDTDTKSEQPRIDQGSATALATALRACLRLHQQVGIDRYPATAALRAFLQPRRKTVAAKVPVAVAPPLPRSAGLVAAGPASAAPRSKEQLSAVYREIEACRLCPHGEATERRCLGQGATDAPLLLVLGDYCSDGTAAAGSVFGVAEDALLWKMMQAIGLGPESVYVTNVLKCPCAGEGESLAVQACQDYVQREVESVQPRVILALGAAAAQAALGREVSLLRTRGRLQPSRFVGLGGQPIMVMVSFHPRALLEQPAMKKAAWQDLQLVQRQLPPLTGTGG